MLLRKVPLQYNINSYFNRYIDLMFPNSPESYCFSKNSFYILLLQYSFWKIPRWPHRTKKRTYLTENGTVDAKRSKRYGKVQYDTM